MLEGREERVFAGGDQVRRHAGRAAGRGQMPDRLDGRASDGGVGARYEGPGFGEGTRRVRFAQSAQRRGRQHGITRIGDKSDQGVDAPKAAEGADGGELHLVFLVGQREDDGVRGDLAAGLGQRIHRRASHLGVVVCESTLEQRHVFV